jgi:uncharacterized protein YceH (UPF0502 family)
MIILDEYAKALLIGLEAVSEKHSRECSHSDSLNNQLTLLENQVAELKKTIERLEAEAEHFKGGIH